jgi:hypothetical protein
MTQLPSGYKVYQSSLSVVLGFVVFVSSLAILQAQLVEPSLPNGPLHLESTPTHRLNLTIELDLPPSEGVVMFPLPPDTASQRVLKCEMTVYTGEKSRAAKPARDLGPFKKPIMTGALPRRSLGKAVVHLELELRASRLVPGKGEQLPPALSRTERIALLDSEWHYEHNDRSFRRWIKENNLTRGKDETDRDFALRALNFIRHNFTYQIPDPQYMKSRVDELGTGQIGFYVAERSAECWGLSRVYTSILRANGVPCRQVSGFMWSGGKDQLGGHHVRAEVYLDGVGWILVEVAGAVTRKDCDLLNLFGCRGNNMVIFSQGVNYQLPGSSGPGNIGTFSNFAVGTKDGRWKFPRGRSMIVVQE